MVNPRSEITFANLKAEELFGYLRDELIGSRIDRLVPDRYRAVHPAHVEGFFRSPEARAMGAGRDLAARRKDGREIAVEIGLNPVATSQGLFTLAVVVDITERKRVEAAHEHLAAIVEYSDDAILSKSLDGVITSWNRAAERLFGYAASEMLGKPVFALIPQARVKEEMGLLDQIRQNSAVNHFETTRLRRDGSEVDVSVTLSPIRGAAGDVVGVSSIIRDITVGKQRDAELQRSNAKLEQFAYVASHDLQEPLRMVANYTELLAQRYRGQLDERADRYIHFATDGARRMQRLIADLLAYSRVGSEGKPIAPTVSGDVVANVVSSLRQAIHHAGATIDYDDLPVVLADDIELGRLFQNLIDNAVKFRSDKPPRIAIGATRTGDWWQFSVADNGIGFEKDYADRIFLMFQRLHERGKYQGSGIGLAIARQIVERHGGRIWVESSPGAGSKFFFTLRAAPGGIR
ncbi:MAG TPA: PAS domain S-box protein [Acetobacteraceae bacterium]|nr:PAS domain S-box protein [Acetobacteraceae bacterium]